MLKLIAGLLIAGTIGLGAAPIAVADPTQGQGAHAGQDAGTQSAAQRATSSAGGQGGGGAPTADAGGAGGGSINDQLQQRGFAPYSPGLLRHGDRGAVHSFGDLIRVIFGDGR